MESFIERAVETVGQYDPSGRPPYAPESLVQQYDLSGRPVNVPENLVQQYDPSGRPPNAPESLVQQYDSPKIGYLQPPYVQSQPIPVAGPFGSIVQYNPSTGQYETVRQPEPQQVNQNSYTQAIPVLAPNYNPAGSYPPQEYPGNDAVAGRSAHLTQNAASFKQSDKVEQKVQGTVLGLALNDLNVGNNM
jgi:hypothetical protein